MTKRITEIEKVFNFIENGNAYSQIIDMSDKFDTTKLLQSLYIVLIDLIKIAPELPEITNRKNYNKISDANWKPLYERMN